jgi:DNA (cytosine-5)-methyltransferase 1
MKSVELFAGAGGMALGIARAGFHHQAAVERDRGACETLRRNLSAPKSGLGSWPLHELDVSHFDYQSIGSDIALLAGGPPCQPFSLGGQHRGVRDERNMFPEMFRAALELRPKAILIENVRGLGRTTFAAYFDYIRSQLSYPEIERKKSENWKEHSRRIDRHMKSRSRSGLTYQVQYRIINAADYGVPQWRERVFIVAFRSDLDIQWEFPRPTHSLDALLADQWISGSYWKRHQLCRRTLSLSESRYAARVESLRSEYPSNNLLPWLTVRDAIHDLPDPLRRDTSRTIPNHLHNPGARAYYGHTGSLLDFPAKTLKAGSHGVPGGENMLAYSNGKVRYFTVRECARLQSFPDHYLFPDVWCAAMKQLGNAVPVLLAEIMARSIATALATHRALGSHKTSRSRVAPTPMRGHSEASALFLGRSLR